MSASVDELTVNYEENGKLIVKELDKVILSKGAWATVMFRYTQWDNKKNDYSADHYTIRRYRKVTGEYRQQSKFNISSPEQALKISDTLKVWASDADAKK